MSDTPTWDGLPPDVSSALTSARGGRPERKGSMTLRFDVYGSNNEEILKMIDLHLEAYAPNSRWSVDVDARPHVKTGGGTTVTYEASVVAKWMGPK